MEEEVIPLIEILSEMTGHSIEDILEWLQNASLDTEEVKTCFGTFEFIKHKHFEGLVNAA